MNAPAVIVLGCVAAAGVWVFVSRRALDSDRLAIAVVLALMAGAFNVIVPLPNVEATTLVVICLALTLGPAAAALAAVVAVLTTSVSGGIGVWTTWQIVGYALVALLGAGAAVACGRLSGRLLVVGLVLVATVIYDVVVTIAGLAVVGTPVAGQAGATVASALLLGAPFTLVHLIANAVLAWLLAPPLVQALGRVRRCSAPATSALPVGSHNEHSEIARRRRPPAAPP